VPGGWVTSDTPSRPSVSEAPTSRSNSEPIAQVAGPDPAARATTTSCGLVFGDEFDIQTCL
jgi:hypothetical protein